MNYWISNVDFASDANICFHFSTFMHLACFWSQLLCLNQFICINTSLWESNYRLVSSEGSFCVSLLWLNVVKFVLMLRLLKTHLAKRSMPLHSTFRTFSPHQLPRSSTPCTILSEMVQTLSVVTLLAYVRVSRLLFLMASGSTFPIMMHLRSLLSLLRGTLGLFLAKTKSTQGYLYINIELCFFTLCFYFLGMWMRFWQFRRAPYSPCAVWI